jgi:thioesterase domain-containing protein
MAAAYAEQILRRHPGGAIHLLGASAGGWYAHAVAEALLERGAAIGALLILDTSAGARVHRRVRWRMLASEVLPRVGTHLSGLLRPPAGQGRSGYVSDRLRALEHQVNRYLGVGLSLLPAEAEPSVVKADPMRDDAFVQLLREAHRPSRLSISVDLFATPRNLSALTTLWRFYARDGVRSYPMFEDHADFFDPELMPELAVVLAEVLAQRDRPS